MVQVKVLIQHIEARRLLPPAVVLQALAPNSHLQLGVVKVLLTTPQLHVQVHSAAVCAPVALP